MPVAVKIACCMFRYFPFGGVQRNFFRIAELLLQRGHEVHLYTLAWDGPPPPAGLRVHVIRAGAWRNHNRYEQFAKQVRERIARERFDLVVGFNKMPGLDVYYCGDPCFEHGARTRRSVLYRMSGRYRHFRAFEQAVFDASKRTQILLLSDVQRGHFQQCYATGDDRFHLLPPYVSRDRAALPDQAAARQSIRDELTIPADHHIVLMVGSDFRRKGVARAIRALASLPGELRSTTHLVVVGKGRPLFYRLLATRLGVAGWVHLLQGRSDVPQLLAAADLLVHPAIEENTGTAIVEALVANLPVIATANCGYAFHVDHSGAGTVIAEPYDQSQFNRLLRRSLVDSAVREQWRLSAAQYVQHTDMFSRPERAVELIEQIGAQRGHAGRGNAGSIAPESSGANRS